MKDLIGHVFRQSPRVRIRGTMSTTFDGSGLNRVQTFLMKTLKPSTQLKYLQALAHLNSDLKVAGISWTSMSEAEQDPFLAEWLVDACEADQGRGGYGWALSAVQNVNPRSSFRTAW